MSVKDPEYASQGFKLSGIDPDHLFAVWWIYHGVPVTPANPLMKGWCVYREVPLDY